MASFKAIFPVLQELFAKNHRGGPFGPPPPSGARVNNRIIKVMLLPCCYSVCVLPLNKRS